MPSPSADLLGVTVIGLRAAQYLSASILLGLPAFMLYSHRSLAPALPGWPRGLTAVAAAILAITALGALVAQAAVMTGSVAEAMKPSTLTVMMTGTSLGPAFAIRAAAAMAVGILLAGKPSSRRWALAALAGLVACASFAWTGHGAATGGVGQWWHASADALHAVAAALWVGALTAFLILVLRAPGRDIRDQGLARALTEFAGLGSVAVGTLLVTGLVNSFFLVGPERLGRLATTPWGQLLLLKLVLFLAMLGLATVNRFRLTPALTASIGQVDHPTHLTVLRLSLTTEFALGIGVLLIVAVMGTLMPPSAL
ncbi:copper homeostasis membrane protein CopD [Brevundimonas sp.]|uniref:copper homeostasis membrane protein CopD n=1 Tax=Brevundimonas sp. TaxID=1871086 RepID=UPI003A91D7A3